MKLNELPMPAIAEAKIVNDAMLETLVQMAQAGKAIDADFLFAKMQQKMRTWLPALKRKYPPALMDGDEDLIQEALLGVWLRFKKPTVNQRFMPYAFGVLRNVAKYSFRRKIRRERFFPHQDGLAFDWTSPLSTDATILESDLLVQLHCALTTLGPAIQNVFELLLQGFDPKDIQQQLKISSPVLHTRIYRGRKAIRRFLNAGSACNGRRAQQAAGKPTTKTAMRDGLQRTEWREG